MNNRADIRTHKLPGPALSHILSAFYDLLFSFYFSQYLLCDKPSQQVPRRFAVYKHLTNNHTTTSYKGMRNYMDKNLII